MKNKIILSISFLQIANFFMLHSMQLPTSSVKEYQLRLEDPEGESTFHVLANIRYNGCVILQEKEVSKNPRTIILYDNNSILQENEIKDYYPGAPSYKIIEPDPERFGPLSISTLKNCINLNLNKDQFTPLNIKMFSEDIDTPTYSIVGFVQDPTISFPNHLSKTKVFLSIALLTGIIVYFLYNKGYKIPFIS